MTHMHVYLTPKVHATYRNEICRNKNNYITPNSIDKITKVTIQNTSFASKRAQVLKRCQTTTGSYVGTGLNTSEKDSDSETQSPTKETFPLKCQPFDQVELDVQIFKKRGGELIPKITRVNDAKKVNVTFWVNGTVRYSDLGENGNLGKFTEDVKKAKFSVTLEANAPEELGDIAKTINKQTTDAIEFVKKWSNKAMGSAFHDEETWKSQSSKHEDDESFIAGAQHSVVKSQEDDDGEVEVLQLTRRLEGWSGEPNRPVFWKMKEDGTYEQVYPKFIKRGAVLSVQMTFRAYQIPGGRYGMAGDLGKHIIVVHSPAAKKKEEKSTAPFGIPYIPFEL